MKSGENQGPVYDFVKVYLLGTRAITNRHFIRGFKTKEEALEAAKQAGVGPSNVKEAKINPAGSGKNGMVGYVITETTNPGLSPKMLDYKGRWVTPEKR